MYEYTSIFLVCNLGVLSLSLSSELAAYTVLCSEYSGLGGGTAPSINRLIEDWLETRYGKARKKPLRLSLSGSWLPMADG